MDKSITFHYCTVICDVLQPSFFEKTTQIVSDFLAFQTFLKVGKFATFSERPKAKSVSASGALRPLTPWPGALPLDSAGGSDPRSPIIGASHLYLGGLQLSNAGTAWEDIYPTPKPQKTSTLAMHIHIHICMHIQQLSQFCSHIKMSKQGHWPHSSTAKFPPSPQKEPLRHFSMFLTMLP